MRVREYMTPDPMVVFRRESVSDVFDALNKNRIHQIPVVDEANRLVGIVTHRDIEAAAEMRKKGMEPRVEDVMTREVKTVFPSTPLREALAILCCERFGAIPVVIGDSVVGILSSRDLLRRFMDQIPQHQESDQDTPLEDHAAGAPW